MNFKNIKEIIDSESIHWEYLLLKEIAADGDAIPNILKILDHERVSNKQLLTETNSELSRALVTIEDENYGNKKAVIDRLWVVEQIKKHYLKWKEQIRCNFKINGLP